MSQVELNEEKLMELTSKVLMSMVHALPKLLQKKQILMKDIC